MCEDAGKHSEWAALRGPIADVFWATDTVAQDIGGCVDKVMAVFLEYLEHAEVLGPVDHEWPDV